MASSTVIATKKTVLTPAHVSTYNQLSASPKAPATVAAANGTNVDDETRRLVLLVDEGLAVQQRSPNNPNGATLASFATS